MGWLCCFRSKCQTYVAPRSHYTFLLENNSNVPIDQGCIKTNLDNHWLCRKLGWGISIDQGPYDVTLQFKVGDFAWANTTFHLESILDQDYWVEVRAVVGADEKVTITKSQIPLDIVK